MGLVSPTHDLGIGMPDVEHRPLTSQKSSSFLSSLLIVDHHAWGGAFPHETVSVSPPISMLTFYPLLWRLHLSYLQVFSREHYSIHSCKFVFLGGGELRIFLCHLEPLLEDNADFS